MELALIPPISRLDDCDSQKYQLMLPQLVQEVEGIPSPYGMKFKQYCEDPEKFVILDNGAAEGVSVPDAYLTEIAEVFGVNELVIPDVMAKGFDNIERAINFLNEYYYLREDGLRFMFVCQGENSDELYMNFLFGMRHPRIDTIAFPRHLNGTLDSSEMREEMVRTVLADEEMFNNGQPRKAIHLLGGDPTHPCEVSHFSPEEKARIRSWDTSSPYCLAMVGVQTPGSEENGPVKRPDAYFARGFTADSAVLVEANIAITKEWVK